MIEREILAPLAKGKEELLTIISSIEQESYSLLFFLRWALSKAWSNAYGAPLGRSFLGSLALFDYMREQLDKSKDAREALIFKRESLEMFFFEPSSLLSSIGSYKIASLLSLAPYLCSHTKGGSYHHRRRRRRGDTKRLGSSYEQVHLYFDELS